MSVISLDDARKELAKRSSSKSQSKPNTQSEEHGPQLTSEEEVEHMHYIFMTVEKARVAPYTTKSDFARIAANEIALAASEGLISTKLRDGKYTNVWMATPMGLEFLEEFADVFGD